MGVDFSFVDEVGEGGEFGCQHFGYAWEKDRRDCGCEEHFSFVFFASAVGDAGIPVRCLDQCVDVHEISL